METTQRANHHIKGVYFMDLDPTESRITTQISRITPILWSITCRDLLYRHDCTEIQSPLPLYE
ncbi:MAG: hypothetical protein SNI51_06680 [Rikenellaceae bacterium]